MSSDESLLDLDYGSSFDGTDDDEESAHCVVPNWSNLPALALEKIYSFLNREDQSRMSLVCRKWSQEYDSPDIWRTVKFFLPEKEYAVEIYPEVRLARKFGKMFHHVEIICKRARYSLLGVIWKQLKFFLQALSANSMLSSIAFINLRIYLRHLEDIVYEDTFRSIFDFFFSQNYLRSVEFRNVYFKKNEGAELLRMIFSNNCRTLNTLKLDGFLNESSDEYALSFVDSTLTFDGLMNLKNGTFDYSDTFENIITSCAEYGSLPDFERKVGNLKKLSIYCDGTKNVKLQGIASDAWKFFKKKCSKLRIDLTYHAGLHARHAFERFVVQHMPVRSLTFKWNRRSVTSSRVEIDSFLSHLVSCGINAYLEELCVIWMQSNTNLALHFINFLPFYPVLKVLQLYVHHPVDSLDALLNMCLEKVPISLGVLYITVGNVQMDVASNYLKLVDDYASLLQVIGITLILVVDPAD